MAADRTGTTLDVHSSDLELSPDRVSNVPKRHARVTVKYNRKELQKRLDVEKWIDESLDRLYSGQEADMPEEVNIDDLIDLPTDEQRVKKLQELLQKCRNNTEPETKSPYGLKRYGLVRDANTGKGAGRTFIGELVAKLEGVHKQEELQTEGIEHPVICHSHNRHEPYHFNNPHQQPHVHTRGQNQTL